MALTEENWVEWYRYFRAAMHRISGGVFSQYDEFLGWEKPELLEEYAGQDYAEAARAEFYLQLSYGN